MKKILSILFAGLLVLAACTKQEPKKTLESFSIKPATVAVTEGESFKITVTAKPVYEDMEVAFKSSDEKVVKVNEKGQVTAIGEGKATITVSNSIDSKTAECSVTVAKKVVLESITVEPSETKLVIGKTLKIEMTPNPYIPDLEFTWASSNSDVVTVDQEGNITGVSEGEATVTVTNALYDKSASVKVTVTINLFSGGSGSASDPYQIANIDDLKLFADYSRGGESISKYGFESAHYIVTKNIEMNCFGEAGDTVDFLSPAYATVEKPFKGTFNGNNKVIYKIFLGDRFDESIPSKTDTVNVIEKGIGLIGVLNGGTVQNVILENPHIESNSVCIGGIVGYAENGQITGCKVIGGVPSSVIDGDDYKDNASVTSNDGAYIYGKGYYAQAGAVTPPPFGEDGYKSQYALVGGIVGYAVGSTVISGCEVNAYVRATNRGVGGIAGALNGSASISNCTQNGLVWGSMTGNGGITGIIVSNTVSDCTVNGCVYGKYSYVGGVVAVTAGTAKIQNCKIENGVVHTGFKNTSGGTRIGGIIGGSWVAAPEVTGCKAINSKILSNATICAAIVGVANNGIVIKDCEVTDCFVDDTNEPENSAAKHEVAGILGWGKVSVDVSGCTVKNSTMVGNAYCSMIVGYADAPLTKITNCTADNCELRAGQSLGGILGAATKHAEISGCEVTNCTIAGTGAYIAGIHGEAQAGTEISNCKVENTSLSQPAAKNFIGGINAYSKVGELKVTDCKVIDIDIFGGGQGNGCVIGRSDFATIVKNCYVSGKIETATAGYNVGGIIGHINSGANAVDLIIDNCAVEADITGGYQVGGICGLSAGTGTTPIIISNVSYVGKLSALSAPANYPNANIAGIVGYANNASQNKPLYVVNAYARPSQIDITSKVTGGSGAIGGLFGYAQWNVSAFIGYSDLVRGKIYKDGVQIDGTQARVGGIAGVTCYTASASYGTLLYKNLYYDSSIGFGPTNDGQGAPDEVDCEGITEAKFTDGTLLSNLNAAVTAYNASESKVATAKAWVAGADGYPVISGLPTK